MATSLMHQVCFVQFCSIISLESRGSLGPPPGKRADTGCDLISSPGKCIDLLFLQSDQLMDQAGASGLDPRKREWSSEDATPLCGTFSSPHPDAFLCHHCHTWRLMVEQLRSGLKGNISGNSRKTSGTPNLEKASEQAGSVSRFICSWDSVQFSSVQLLSCVRRFVTP